MTTIEFAPTALRRSDYDRLSGKPLFHWYAVLEPSCPACEGRVRSMGFADWVRTEGQVITLWQCLTPTCRLHELEVTLRLVADVVDDADVYGPHQVFGLAVHVSDCAYADDQDVRPANCCRQDDLWHTWEGLSWAMTMDAAQAPQGHPDINQCQCETVSRHWAIVEREAARALPTPADDEYRLVAWHPEDKPGQQSRATLCGYHYRLAKSCLMIDADYGRDYAATPVCEVCR